MKNSPGSMTGGSGDTERVRPVYGLALVAPRSDIRSSRSPRGEDAYVTVGLLATATRCEVIALGQAVLEAAHVGVLRRQVHRVPLVQGTGDGVLGLLQRLDHGRAVGR